MKCMLKAELKWQGEDKINIERKLSHKIWFKVSISRAPVVNILSHCPSRWGSLQQAYGKALSGWSERCGKTQLTTELSSKELCLSAPGVTNNNAATCLTDHSYTQNKMLFLVYTSGIDSRLLEAFCRCFGQSVNKKNGQAGGRGTPSSTRTGPHPHYSESFTMKG